MSQGAVGAAGAPSAADVKSILVVEDDDMIRCWVTEYLSDCGFNVMAAESGDEAMAILDRRAGDIHLVFSDVRMPGTTNGLALAAWIRRRMPAIGVLLTSGYFGKSERVAAGGGEFPLLPKPYRLAELVDRVQLLLRPA
jgi:CheY-like chemotaxis protein